LLTEKKYGFKDIKNEWEFNELFKKRNIEYLKINYQRYLKDAFIKLNFIFFYPFQDANTGTKNIDEKELKYSMIVNKVFLSSAIIIAFCALLKKFNKKTEYKEEFYYFLILSLIIPVFVVGWATSKHLVGICNVSIIYLINYFIINKKKIKLDCFTKNSDVEK